MDKNGCAFPCAYCCYISWGQTLWVGECLRPLAFVHGLRRFVGMVFRWVIQLAGRVERWQSANTAVRGRIRSPGWLSVRRTSSTAVAGFSSWWSDVENRLVDRGEVGHLDGLRAGM